MNQLTPASTLKELISSLHCSVDQHHHQLSPVLHCLLASLPFSIPAHPPSLTECILPQSHLYKTWCSITLQSPMWPRSCQLPCPHLTSLFLVDSTPATLASSGLQAAEALSSLVLVLASPPACSLQRLAGPSHSPAHLLKCQLLRILDYSFQSSAPNYSLSYSSGYITARVTL